VHAANSGEVQENPVNSRMSLESPVTECGMRSLRGVKVLVVDDELDAREVVKRSLDKYGAVTAVAASAAEAQTLLLRFEPDVIVSDIGMPEMDGYEFMREARKQGIKTPALALSAYVRAEDSIRSSQSGYQSHLGKPVEMTQLVAVIANLAGR
jgi:CheY-like chemotaxis protein